MSAYYNEIDPFAAQWLRELIKAGHIALGEVDTRSIENVAADDLAGFTQCHFFAGIGTWSYALRCAGWPDDRPVWTGSCPCQPFSSARQAKERGLLTSGTCGPPSSVSSASAALTSFLASRLQALTALHGSTLYRLTWKQRTTPAGRSIPALRASVPRTSDKGCTGWPTPTGNSYTGAGSGNRAGRHRSAEAGHSTGNPARAFNSKSRLEDIVFLTGWVTPSARDWKDTPGMATERPDGRNRTDQLPRQAATTYPCRLTVSGEMLTGFCAGMESGGQLNPALARWLMGLPPEWDDCGAMVTPLSRRKRKPS